MRRTYNAIRENGARLKRLLRHFPYTEYLIFAMPVYALLVSSGSGAGIWDLLKILPFIPASFVVFAYNDIRDRNDPDTSNPVVDDRSKSFAKGIMYLAVASSVSLFVITYRNPLSYLICALSFTVGFAYSGAGIRLKETIFGTIAASLVGWVSVPAILAVEYGISGNSVFALLAGVFFLGVSRETSHTLLDYDSDMRSGYQTFAIRVGKNAAMLVKYLCMLIGLLFLMHIAALPPILTGLLVAGIALTSAVELVVDVRNPSLLREYANSPYVLARGIIILQTCAILGLPEAVAAILLWAYVTSKRG
jgi:4-hydroxybenzoate polyprenyltransferase